MDERDPSVGFTIDWVEEFAKHVDNVYVLTMFTGQYNVSDNVKVFTIGHDKGYSKIRLLWNFYVQFFKIIFKYKIDGCFAHMQPLFAALSGFFLRISGKKLVTWYAHPSLTKTLRIAHFFSTNTVASVYEAYPHKKNKLKVIGQAIDTDIFVPAKNKNQNTKVEILYTGRVSTSKNIETLINAVAILLQEDPVLPLSVKIVGDPVGEGKEEYNEMLHNLAKERGIYNIVEFKPFIKRKMLVPIYQAADIFVNLTPVGFGDKVAWEAMACGIPTIVANPGFIETLGKFERELFYEYGNAEALALKLKGLIQIDKSHRREMGLYLREQVIQLHSMVNLPPKVLALLK